MSSITQSSHLADIKATSGESDQYDKNQGHLHKTFGIKRNSKRTKINVSINKGRRKRGGPFTIASES